MEGVKKIFKKISDETIEIGDLIKVIDTDSKERILITVKDKRKSGSCDGCILNRRDKDCLKEKLDMICNSNRIYCQALRIRSAKKWWYLKFELFNGL